uniref:Uncharacterized protein n=1 Tax=Anguilla anguilla TaxID=7936 RepID=A0A0E9RZP6_ANGAN
MRITHSVRSISSPTPLPRMWLELVNQCTFMAVESHALIAIHSHIALLASPFLRSVDFTMWW